MNKINYLSQVIADSLKPALLRAAHAWADEKRILPAGSAEPGRWNSRRAPWVLAITEAMRDPRYAEVIAALGAQMSKTDGVLMNIIGWLMDEHPSPTMYIGPTRKNIESISKDRLFKMIRSVVSLLEALAKGRNETVHEKFINGQRLGLAWAGSPTELASHPVQNVLLDEVDRMPKDVGGEGDPYTLAKARTSTYKARGKACAVSTPTNGLIHVDESDPLKRWQLSDDHVDSLIWDLWQGGTRHEWAFPCPHCLEFFIAKSSLLHIPDVDSLREIEKNAALICPHCGSEVIDHDHKNAEHYQKRRFKNWMNARGLFIAPGQSIKRLEDLEASGCSVMNTDGSLEWVEFGFYLAPHDCHKVASFWVSGLCSPWRTFGERATGIVQAKRSMNPGKIQAAYNTMLGECYELSGEAPAWQLVADRRRKYERGQVPAGVQTIVAGVDVQADRLVVAIRGFGAGCTSWLIDAFELYGPTSEDEIWNELAAFRAKKYAGFVIKVMLVDSGYNPNSKAAATVKHRVYQFCLEQKGWAIPTKGHKDQDQPWRFNRIDAYKNKKVSQNLNLVHFSNDYYKQSLYGELGREDGRINWVIPASIDDEYCRQVVSEVRISSDRDFVWKKIRRDNHYLDSEVLCLVASDILRVRELSSDEPPNLADPIAIQKTVLNKPKPIKRRLSSGVNYD